MYSHISAACRKCRSGMQAGESARLPCGMQAGEAPGCLAGFAIYAELGDSTGTIHDSSQAIWPKRGIAPPAGGGSRHPAVAAVETVSAWGTRHPVCWRHRARVPKSSDRGVDILVEYPRLDRIGTRPTQLVVLPLRLGHADADMEYSRDGSCGCFAASRRASSGYTHTSHSRPSFRTNSNQGHSLPPPWGPSVSRL